MHVYRVGLCFYVSSSMWVNSVNLSLAKIDIYFNLDFNIIFMFMNIMDCYSDTLFSRVILSWYDYKISLAFFDTDYVEYRYNLNPNTKYMSEEI